MVDRTKEQTHGENTDVEESDGTGWTDSTRQGTIFETFLGATKTAAPDPEKAKYILCYYILLTPFSQMVIDSRF